MSPLREHDGEAAAARARTEWGLGMIGPVGDLLDVVESAVGIPVLIEEFGAADMCGVLMQRADDSAFIAINADRHNTRRQRFTLAHELGHFRMDHQPRVDYVENIEGGKGGRQEVEANYFAAEFLCPRVAVLDWLDRNDIKQADAAVAARLAMEFGLSFSTACFRLERVEEFSAPTTKRVLQQLNADPKGFAHRHEPLRLIDQIERLDQADRAGEHAYPRPPLQTRTYAATALDVGLIDRDEYEHLVGRLADESDPAA